MGHDGGGNFGGSAKKAANMKKIPKKPNPAKTTYGISQKKKVDQAGSVPGPGGVGLVRGGGARDANSFWECEMGGGGGGRN